MITLAVIAISFLVSVACVLVHYEVLRYCSTLFPRGSRGVRSQVLLVIGGVFLAHLIEIFLFALAYYLMVPHPRFGTIQGDFSGTVQDFFYFSITSYTTLGVGDVLALGPLRVVAGVQALVGFVLTGWSASFIYLAMERFWGLHRSRQMPHPHQQPPTP